MPWDTANDAPAIDHAPTQTVPDAGPPSTGAADSTRITAMTVSPNRRLLAVAERGERPTVTVYDLTTMKKRKVLSHTEAGTKASKRGLHSLPCGGRRRSAWPLLCWYVRCLCHVGGACQALLSLGAQTSSPIVGLRYDDVVTVQRPLAPVCGGHCWKHMLTWQVTARAFSKRLTALQPMYLHDDHQAMRLCKLFEIGVSASVRG